MVLGLKTGRVHHYLSDLEYACHLLAEFRSDVCDIREQCALLPWKETQQIAEGLKIRHPIYLGSKTPVVMTSDLLLTSEKEEGKSYEVICVKPSSATTMPRETDLPPSEFKKKSREVRRTLEKLLIEKTYWDLRGVPWYLVTDQDIPHIRVQNLDLLRICMVADELDWVNSYMEDFLTAFDSVWRTDRTLLNILDRTNKEIGLSRNECFTLFGRAVWLRFLPVDIDKEVIHQERSLCRLAIKGDDKC